VSRGPVPEGRKRPEGDKPLPYGDSDQPTEKPEPPSDEPEAVKKLSEENVRKASEALRALKLPNEAEPCTVFKP